LYQDKFQSNLVYLTDFGIRARSYVASGNLIEGTRSYLAPERVAMEWQPTKESDVWAVGCIGYEMCIGRQLSYNRQAIDNVIEGGELDLSDVDDDIYGDEIKGIIRECLQRNPDDRCSARQLRDYIGNLFA
jgi:serine/threonine protein kinase